MMLRNLFLRLKLCGIGGDSFYIRNAQNLFHSGILLQVQLMRSSTVYRPFFPVQTILESTSTFHNRTDLELPMKQQVF